MKKLPKKFNKTWLLKNLPTRKWDEIREYDKIYIVPTRKKHDSGYALIAIIGVIGELAEIAAYCDDINWKFSEIGSDKLMLDYGIRTDCFYPSGIIQFHSIFYLYEVGCCTSSTDIKVKLKKKHDNAIWN